MNNVNKAYKAITALAHSFRMQLIQYIHNNEEVNVTDIIKHFKISQTAASHELKRLRDHGFLNAKYGNGTGFRDYSVNYDKLLKVQSSLKDLINNPA